MKQLEELSINKAKVCVLGAGSWGTALATVLAYNNFDVCIWARDAEVVNEINNKHRNSKYLPQTQLNKCITATLSFAQAIQNKSLILLAIPSSSFENIIKLLREHLRDDDLSQQNFVLASKGFVKNTCDFMHVFIQKIFHNKLPLAVLSGPSFATEVVLRHPTAVCISSFDGDYANRISDYFHNDYFRTYVQTDLIGVQIGGAMKNILAFATGAIDGLSLGPNTQAALLTRGLREITRLASALGAKESTLMGLSGLGDLILTATDNRSRNRRYGYYLAQGLSRHESLAKIGQAVECIVAVDCAYKLSKKYNIQLPIVEQVYAVIHQDATIEDAILQLTSRPKQNEE